MAKKQTEPLMRKFMFNSAQNYQTNTAVFCFPARFDSRYKCYDPKSCATPAVHVRAQKGVICAQSVVVDIRGSAAYSDCELFACARAH